MGKYGRIVTSVWEPENCIKNKLFEEKGALHPMQTDYIDIPYLYTNTEHGMDFIYALSSTKPEKISLFGLKSVQILIDGHFVYWRKMSIFIIGIPMLL